MGIGRVKAFAFETPDTGVQLLDLPGYKNEHQLANVHPQR